ncbi:MAG: carboxypeptidase-like regulatory domain-containing protein, partial [Acidobacteriota bacterium]
MRKIISSIIAFATLLLFTVIGLAQSQATTGTIQGTVSDPNGAVISGASVIVKNTQTGFERTVVSNSDGYFTAPLLPLGKYRITTNASGF